ncbi:Uncharacterised protein [uncultured archaeon]|nr:Uncharacterised protein [uncultured archaeon]
MEKEDSPKIVFRDNSIIGHEFDLYRVTMYKFDHSTQDCKGILEEKIVVATIPGVKHFIENEATTYIPAKRGIEFNWQGENYESSPINGVSMNFSYERIFRLEKQIDAVIV